MNILLLGNSLDIFAKELGEELKNIGHQVSFLDIATLKIVSHDATVNTTYMKKFSQYKNIPKINVPIKFFLMCKIINDNNYEIINILGNSWKYIFLLKCFKRAAAKCVITFYGSDFYRTSSLIRFLQVPLYKTADALTFTNPMTKESFLQYYKNFYDKSFVCRFGLKTLDFIDKNRMQSRIEMREHLGYDVDKIIITCGYNATDAQQHEKIINSLQTLKSDELDKVQLVFPLTYGDTDHREFVKELLRHSSLNYIVLEEFLYEDDNAYIKLASDIMINILKTDSFSGSMQEFLYAGNVVITGDWLPYKLFDESCMQYEKIKNTNELSEKIVYCIEHLTELRENIDKNESIIKTFSSWSKTIQNWIDVYTFAKEKNKS